MFGCLVGYFSGFVWARLAYLSYCNIRALASAEKYGMITAWQRNLSHTESHTYHGRAESGDFKRSRIKNLGSVVVQYLHPTQHTRRSPKKGNAPSSFTPPLPPLGLGDGFLIFLSFVSCQFYTQVGFRMAAIPAWALTSGLL